MKATTVHPKYCAPPINQRESIPPQAKTIESRVPSLPLAVHTPPPPQQQPLTEKVDVYSMAMTFYTMLSLHPPYTGELGAKERILNGIPPSVDPSWHPGFVEVSVHHPACYQNDNTPPPLTKDLRPNTLVRPHDP